MQRKDFIRNTVIAIAACLLPKILQPQEIELSNATQVADYKLYVREYIQGEWVEIACIDNLSFSVDLKHY